MHREAQIRASAQPSRPASCRPALQWPAEATDAISQGPGQGALRLVAPYALSPGAAQTAPGWAQAAELCGEIRAQQASP